MVVKELFARLGLEIDEVAFAKGEAAIGALKKSWLAFGGAVVAGLAVGAAAIAKSTANAADHARKLAQRTGVDSIALQEFAHAAELADVSVEELAHGMQRLAKSGVKDVRGGMLQIAEQFHKLPDDGSRVQFLMEKFGRAGAQLAPMFSGGREELEHLMAEAHELGIVFTEEDQVAAEEFNDELTRLGEAMAGLRNIIGLALIKPLTKVVTALKNGIVALRTLKPAMEKFIMVAKGVAFVVGGVLLAALLGNAAAIALNVSWYAALAIASIAAAAKAALAWAIAAAPVVAAGLAIAFVLAVLEDLYQFLTGGESVIGDFVDYVKDQFGTWPEFFKAVMDWIGYLLVSSWGGNYDAIKEWMGKAKDEVFRIVDLIVSKFTSMPGALKSGLLGMASQIPGVGAAVNVAASLSPLFGGGGSPAASVGSAINTTQGNTVNAPQFKATITVNAAPGMSAQEVANQVTAANENWWGSKLREATAGVE